MIDLLGNESKRKIRSKGSAASHGTGPNGEKCKTCAFCQQGLYAWHTNPRMKKQYFCSLTQGQINSTAAACALWEGKGELPK